MMNLLYIHLFSVIYATIQIYKKSRVFQQSYDLFYSAVDDFRSSFFVIDGARGMREDSNRERGGLFQ